MFQIVSNLTEIADWSRSNALSVVDGVNWRVAEHGQPVLDSLTCQTEWADVLQDLDTVTQTLVESSDGKRFPSLPVVPLTVWPPCVST